MKPPRVTAEEKRSGLADLRRLTLLPAFTSGGTAGVKLVWNDDHYDVRLTLEHGPDTIEALLEPDEARELATYLLMYAHATAWKGQL